MSLELVSKNKSFDGWHKQYKHHSASLNSEMRFAIYLPEQASKMHNVPVLYWLSGLTCTDENFMQKSGAQRIAAELGIALVAPDTSPRGEHIADDEQYDLGQGAGFYVNATQAPWAKHYRMYDYVVDELPQLIESHFPVTNKRAISGHSMGGHGALMIALSNPTRYCSASAFSPICNPTHCPWGQKAFAAYLGEDRQAWSQYDTCELLKKAVHKIPIKVDQGAADPFLTEQLRPQELQIAAEKNHYPLEYGLHEGYDHSYYFIASFVKEHIHFHAEYLNNEISGRDDADLTH